MTAGTFFRRDQERIQTLISWALFHCSLPLQRKPETLSPEADAYIGEKGHSSATLLTVMAVSKILPSTKETNLLRHLSCGRTNILVIIDCPTKNGRKCVLQKSAITWSYHQASSWLKQKVLHWAVYVQGFPLPHTLGCRLELPSKAAPELPAAVERQRISNTKGTLKVIHAIKKPEISSPNWTVNHSKWVHS